MPFTHQYSLAPQVHACLVDGCAVFLDLPNDRYLGLDREDSARLQTSMTVSGLARQPPATDPATADLVKRLLEQGVLRDSPTNQNWLRRQAVPTPTEDYLHDTAPCTWPTAAEAMRLLAAAARTSAALRCRSLNETVSGLLRQRAHSAPAQRADIPKATLLTKKFLALRPFYARKYLCLFDCLALLDFLARYRIYPRWVFGVQLFPFSAHCWIQIETMLLNDTLETIRHYTPIMAI